jgi:hypothetical protein
MQRALPPLLFVSALLAALFCGLGVRRSTPESALHAAAPAAELAPAPKPVEKLQLQGVASCAAAACHNGNGPRGSKGSEYTTWITHDPHARAYTVLYDHRSQQIQKELGATVPAHKDKLCQSCHVQPDIRDAAHNDRFTLADGVGCESCHGPAQKWLSRHYLPISEEEKRSLGMTNTKNLVRRAEACVACHVGKGDNDVNHDLIAAGHPRLRFEYGAYLANYPKHWSESEDLSRSRDFQARAWIVGQLVSARASLDLLHHRASKADKPWPEFAEYGCFACHHSLKDQGWKEQHGYGKQPPGSLPWGTWYYGLLPLLSEKAPGKGKDVVPALDQLHAAMVKRLPSRKNVAKEAATASEALDGLLHRWEKSGIDEKRLTDLIDDLAKQKDLAGASWDSATQLYLGLGGLYAGLQDLDPRWRQPELKQSIRGMGRQLQEAFPPKERSIYDTPDRFSPRLLEKSLQNVREHLPR